MATSSSGFLPTLNKMNFPGPVGSKRRRMRSGGTVSTSNNDGPDLTLEDMDEISVDGKTTQTSKCKGATTIPLFLKKTYKMIDSCDPTICSWSEDGETFTVRDPDTFATQVIPQYFDHNKFSSFARQLNFYGFRKMQSKPIKNSDFDAGSAKHVTFHNENFKRGRCDLLKRIQRSTRGGSFLSGQDQSREIQDLKNQVNALEEQITEMSGSFEDRLRRLEIDMLARMEQMMMAMQQQQQTNLQPSMHVQTLNNRSANGLVAPLPAQSLSNQQSVQPHQQVSQQQQHQDWETDIFAFPGRTASIGVSSLSNFQQLQPEGKLDQSANGATLAPHPKQKVLPVNSILPPGGLNQRFSSLRGFSTLSRGLSGLTRGASIESTASGMIMKNSWDDKLFSMLMLGDNAQAQDQVAALETDANNGGPSSRDMQSSVVHSASVISDNAHLTGEGAMDNI